MISYAVKDKIDDIFCVSLLVYNYQPKLCSVLLQHCWGRGLWLHDLRYHLPELAHDAHYGTETARNVNGSVFDRMIFLHMNRMWRYIDFSWGGHRAPT